MKNFAAITISFVKSMDRNFVRPPIMRTNAIIKNKYFRECPCTVGVHRKL